MNIFPAAYNTNRNLFKNEEAEKEYYQGVNYANGHNGVEQSHKKANEYFKSAAEKGFAKAQYELAAAYANGEGKKQSYQKAYKWCKLAAEQGHIEAQYRLSALEKSEVKAFKWRKLAAKQGHAAAQHLLGLSYIYARGVEKSDEKGIYWIKLSAEQGYADAQQTMEIIDNFCQKSANR